MNDPNSNKMAWDHSSDALQGIFDRQLAPTSPQMGFPSDGLMTSSEVALSDPASFLGLQFGPDPAVIPHSHFPLFNQRPSFHRQASSPPPLDSSQYHPLRLTSHQDAWNPLQVTGVPVNPSAWGIQQPGYSSRSCTTQSVTTSYAMESISSPCLAPHEHEQDDRVSTLDLGPSQYGDATIDAMEMVESPPRLCNGIIKCDYPNCQWTGKCPSDKKKHEARHQKSHKCNEPGCTRKEGFGTINDLWRHRKCVHKQEPERGPKVVYKCFGRNCTRPEKEWPRLDNFRQHLSRLHCSEDTAELLKKSHDWYETYVKPRAMTSSFVDRMSEEATPTASEPKYPKGDSGQDLHNTDHPNQPIFQSPGYPILESTDGHQSLRRNSSLDCTPPLPTAEGTQQFELPILTALNLSSTVNPEASALSQVASQNKTEDMVSKMAASMVNAMATMLNNDNSADNNNQSSQQANIARELSTHHHNDELPDQKREILQKILSKALDQVSRNPMRQANAQPRPDPKSDKRGWIQCEFCTKRTRLRCEMKKHKKRHERPYGCTFEKCNKTFGSKADWKRHENSQHFHLQSWRCTLQDPAQGGLPCARLFDHPDSYILHLTRHHCVNDDKAQTALSRNRIGRDGQPQFWCGFCRDIIPLRNQGLAAWNERFNHIDTEHFKKGERIGDWLLPSGHLTKEKEREVERKRVETAIGEGVEPIAEDNSDDDSASSLDHSDNENARGDVTMVEHEIRDHSYPQERSYFDNTSMFPHMDEPANMRKRKYSAPQPSLEYYLRPEVPIHEKRYKTDDSIGTQWGDLVYCCQCAQGPLSWSYTTQCLYCPHNLCSNCGSERQALCSR
ncbi:hypothetical protein BDV25DRAFT_167505 [Aspergillus avenaceus]|uniref:C2H2-type domain-containing protein n=1 Tax=Aspergillus avenaceus TaxID=36643 RepID=A0A5N6TD16_ASPAV|nr:hypothetical protein BDV25DRAFT_167505 [Aspergillus avenaceus]